MSSPRFQVTFDCADPAALATFWAAVLSYPPPDFDTLRDRMRAQGVAEEDFDNWCAIEDPSGGHPRLFFQRVPEPKVAKNRMHLDVQVTNAVDPAEQRRAIDAEVQRLVPLGARRLRSITDEAGYFVVLQDPEGNEFCLDSA